MRILLDTHVLVWALIEPERIEPAIRSQIEDDPGQVLFSAVSIWEIAIKARLRRPGFVFHPGEIAKASHDTGFAELPVRSDAAARLLDLPLLHRDPFDHLLIAQAMTEPALLYTADRQLVAYSELVREIRSR